MRASVALPSAADAAETVTLLATRLSAFAQRRRWWILGACVAAQWFLVTVLALTSIHHNGWIYQHGDDGPWYWTSAWTLTTSHVPNTGVGPGWPYVLSPLAAIFGPDMADGLPFLMALNVLILAPLAVLGMYLVGERIAGKLFGVWTACLWMLLPVAGILLYGSHSRTVLLQSFLPTATGLNALADYPSMVCAIYAAYLVLRMLDRDDLRDAVLGGIALGFLVLLKPANGPEPLAAFAVLLIARRWRGLLGVAAGMLPALVALTIWKKTGTGVVPLVASHGAGSAPPPASGAGSAPQAHVDAYHHAVNLMHRYVNLDMHHLGQNAHALREVFWSLRLLEFLLVAGALALVARSRSKGLFVVGWFVAFGLIKGTVSYSGIYDTSVYRFLLPAWPAWALIVAGLVFWWPVGSASRARQADAERARIRSLRPLPTRPLVWAAVLFALGPLAVVAAASPMPKGSIAQMDYSGAPIAVVDFGLRAQQTGPHQIRLDWKPVRTGRATYGYRVFKGANDGCFYEAEGAPVCLFRMELAYFVPRGTTFRDSNVSGRTVYRVALAAGARIDPNSLSDLLLLSKPTTITPK